MILPLMSIGSILLIIAGVILVSLSLFYSSYSIGAGIYVNSLCKKDTKEKVVTITFDDGPHPEQTPKILEILSRRGVEASFFCIGENIENNKLLARRIYDEGHIIGNHSHSHTWKFPWSGYKKMNRDVLFCEKVIEDVTGKRTALFRSPFGVTNPTVAKMVRSLGYTSIGWSIRSLDTSCRGDTDKTLKRIERKLRPGSIILLHDGLPFSDELLESLLDMLSAKGYHIERLDRFLGIEADKE